MPFKKNPYKTFFIYLGVAAALIGHGYTADITPPTTTYVQTPSSPDGKNSWYKTPVRFDLTATDLESGVKEINYRIDTGVWQKVTFSDTLNLAPNPSMETAGVNTSGVDSWEASVVDASSTYTQDVLNYATGFPVASSSIVSTGAGWHGINNRDTFSVSASYDSMTASAWVKTDSVLETAYFKMYAIVQDINGVQTTLELAQSNAITGTQPWTKLTANFVANVPNVIGVYMDIGFTGTGSIWMDAVSISTAMVPSTTTFTVGSDSASHTVEFYAVDFLGNTETYSCTTPKKHCITFKSDATAPTNWHDSGAVRNIFSPSYLLWAYTNVDDPTSGISTFSDSYQIHTELHADYGKFSNIFSCSSTWQPNSWLFLITPPFVPGAKTVYLVTPPTSFCNNNWRACKIVRFKAEDMAGNVAMKDFCINGPWIELRGEGVVRANANIDMLSEGQSDNTDGLIESGGTRVDFFTSTEDWIVKESPTPTNYDYDAYYSLAKNKTHITDDMLRANTGTYRLSGDFTIDTGAIPTGYTSSTFNQVVFVDGDLTISNNVDISASSTALFIVKGDVNIDKTVETVGIAIFADGDINTAYNVAEGDATPTLNFKGVYSTNKFISQRTLQGTNNSSTPSESFTYEPKYLIQQKDFFGKYSVYWKNTQ